MSEISSQNSSEQEVITTPITEPSTDSVETPSDAIEPPREESINFVSVETDADTVRRKNMYYSNAFTGFVWMLFHFTVVFFFGLQLQSVALVGIFLAFGNLVSFAFDVPVGILIKFFGEKNLAIAGTFSQLIAGAIFLKFIYFSAVFAALPHEDVAVVSLLTNFLDSTTNILLLVLASFCYGFTKEVNDITTYSYIMNNADPSEYSSIISRNNIFSGGGAMVGLVSSGVVLSFSPVVAVIILNVFILILMGFVLFYYDNHANTINFSDVQKLKIIAEKDGLSRVKDYLIGYVSKADFAAIAKTTKFLFLRPVKRRDDFSVKNVIEETKKELFCIKATLAGLPYHIGLFWIMGIVLAFGFWDTFASSFLVDFLAKASKPELAYAMLGVIAIPAFLMQEPFIKLSEKIGAFWVVIIGLWLSGGSLFMMSMVESPMMIILCGIINSFGYAAGMGMSQGGFLNLYNKVYAKKMNLTEIDSNSSASPMKMLQNLANILGLVLGGFLLGIFDYTGFFAIFGILLIGGLGASIMYKKTIGEIS